VKTEGKRGDSKKRAGEVQSSEGLGVKMLIKSGEVVIGTFVGLDHQM